MRPQGVGLADAIDADDIAEVPGLPGLHPRKRVLEDGGVGRCRVERPGAREERVRRRLAGQLPFCDDHPVDPGLDEARQPGGVEHGLAVGRRGDDRDPHAGPTCRLEVAHRPRIGIDATLGHDLPDPLVLAVTDSLDGLVGRGRVRRPLRQLDAARDEESPDAVEPRTAVDVVVVIRVAEQLLAAAREQWVERLLPRGSMQRGSPRENAIEVEQAGAHMVGEADHTTDATRTGIRSGGTPQSIKERSEVEVPD